MSKNGKKFTYSMAKNAKPKDKPYKMFTGNGGLYLHIFPTGRKTWKSALWLYSKEINVTHGNFLLMSYTEALNEHLRCKKLVTQGENPNKAKKEEKEARKREALAQGKTFINVALEWFKTAMTNKAASYQNSTEGRLKNLIFPYIGDIPITELDRQSLLIPCRKAEERGAIPMAHILCQVINSVCQYAQNAGYTQHNNSINLGKALKPMPQQQNRACIRDPLELGRLLNDIDSYSGDIVTTYALKILPYVATRSVELLGAAWSEFNFNKATWEIPAERMKKRNNHIVRLSSQVLSMLAELREYTGGGLFLFPSPKKSGKHIVSNSLLKALRKLGWDKDKICGHGFRGTFSSILHERGFNHEIIEYCLAHKTQSKTSAAYNHSLRLPERLELMQAWADYLDGLKAKAREAHKDLISA